MLHILVTLVLLVFWIGYFRQPNQPRWILFSLIIMTVIIGFSWLLTYKKNPSEPTNRFAHSTVVFDNKLWIMGGIAGFGNDDQNDVWNSTDGYLWHNVTENAGFSPRNLHTSLVYNNQIWVIGGWTGNKYSFGNVFSSTDGANWNLRVPKAEFDKRHGHTSAYFKNKMWVIAGMQGLNYTNDIYTSTDGQVWNKINTTHIFSKRTQARSVIFKDKIWIIGGFERVRDKDKPASIMGKAVYHNDIYASSDGSEWEFIGKDFFPGRSAHTVTVFKDTLWIIGGIGQNGPLSDIYCSGDGYTWSKVTENAVFGPRKGHSSIVFRDSIWLIGGNNKIKGVGSRFVSGDGKNYKEILQVTVPVLKKTESQIELPKTNKPVRKPIMVNIGIMFFFICVASYSKWFLFLLSNESRTAIKVIGILFIIAGVWYLNVIDISKFKQIMPYIRIFSAMLVSAFTIAYWERIPRSYKTIIVIGSQVIYWIAVSYWVKLINALEPDKLKEAYSLISKSLIIGFISLALLFFIQVLPARSKNKT